MKKLLIICILFLTTSLLFASDVNRVRKYLANCGYSNAVNGVDFNLRNDMDGKGTYIENWIYTNKIPKISECPKDKEADQWADLVDNPPEVVKPVEIVPELPPKPVKSKKPDNISTNRADYKYKLTGNIGQSAKKEKDKEKKAK